LLGCITVDVIVDVLVGSGIGAARAVAMMRVRARSFIAGDVYAVGSRWCGRGDKDEGVV